MINATKQTKAKQAKAKQTKAKYVYAQPYKLSISLNKKFVYTQRHKKIRAIEFSFDFYTFNDDGEKVKIPKENESAKLTKNVCKRNSNIRKNGNYSVSELKESNNYAELSKMKKLRTVIIYNCFDKDVLKKLLSDLNFLKLRRLIVVDSYGFVRSYLSKEISNYKHIFHLFYLETSVSDFENNACYGILEMQSIKYYNKKY